MRTAPRTDKERYQLLFALLLAQRSPKEFLRYPCPTCRRQTNRPPIEVPALRNMIADVEAVVSIAPGLERAHSLHIPVEDYFYGLFELSDM